MPRDVKQDRRGVADERAAPTSARDAGPTVGRNSSQASSAGLSFAARDPHGEPPAPPRRAPLAVALALVVAAVVAALAPLPPALRLVLPLSLVTAAALLALRARAHATAAEAPARSLHLEADRLSFQARSELLSLVDLSAPFGVTLLASPRRDRLLVLLSSSSGTYSLGAACDPGARRALAPLLERALTVAGDDAGLEAIGPDGEPLSFPPEELAALVEALLERSPTCLERFVLTDVRGAPLTLDGRRLCVGDRAVDLDAPLDWKPIVFQETFGQAVAVYQGTWVRQGGTELVLVSLLPALGPPQGADVDLATLDRAVLRDLRLMAASPEPPPPAEQRVAIERLFMLPLRSALDRAPRASHQPNRAQA